MEDEKTTCVVIVTYNRKMYLINLIKALLQQTDKPAAIFIYENHSPDDTADVLCKEGYIPNIVQEGVVYSKKFKNVTFFYIRSVENTGGSGGFNSAFNIVKDLQYDFIWAMDDDVLPERDCLHQLKKYISDESYMCVPSRGDQNFNDYAITEYDLTSLFKFKFGARKSKRILYSDIKTDFVNVVDMAFEGPFFKRDLIKTIGLPNKEFFLTFDDTDYAQRASKVTNIRYIPSAHLHKQIIPDGKNPFNWKVYYGIRNTVYFDNVNGKNWKVRNLRPKLFVFDLLIKATGKFNFNRIPIIIQAYKDGMDHNLGRKIEPGSF